MNLNINRNLFSHINTDSGSLSILSTITHQFNQPGHYEGIVMKGSIITRRFGIVVTEGGSGINENTETSTITSGKKGLSSTISSSLTQGTMYPKQMLIDLKDTSPDQFVLATKGYAVFYVSAGLGGYAIEVHRFEKGNQIKVFDSSLLKDEDTLSVNIIRPGTYSITNTINNAKADLVVKYPELKKLQKNPQPVKVECSVQNQFNPDKVTLDPAQGLIFIFKTPSRIKIDLTKPEDRPPRIRKERILARREKEKGEIRFIRKYRLMPSGNPVQAPN